MRALGILLVAALALAACDKPKLQPEAAREAADGIGVVESGAGDAVQAAAGGALQQTGAQLAYEHAVRVVAPAKRAPGLFTAHMEACARAVGRCQVISAQSSVERGEANAKLVLRSEAKWLQAFRANLADDLERAGGRILETTTTSEDLTQQIIDVEARLRAQRTLRDRLQALLASKPGKLAELLEVERELARVQGELDAATSTLQVYHARVATELLTLSYESAPTAASANAWSPLTNAFADFSRVLASSLAALVTLIAVVSPFALPLLIAWLFWRMLRKRTQKKSAP